MVDWTVSSILFLLSFQLAWDVGRPGHSVSDKTDDGPGAATALRAAAADGINLTGTAGPAPDGLADLHVIDRVAQANVHCASPYTVGQPLKQARNRQRMFRRIQCRGLPPSLAFFFSPPKLKHV
jgi:hypothetical protein